MTHGQVVELPNADLLATLAKKGEACVCPVHGDHGNHEPGQVSRLQRRVSGVIVVYQRAREGRPSPCRFFPSCSAYALESVDVHGVWRGGWLSLRRLVRCRPLGPSGVDLVPGGLSSTATCECGGADAPTLPTPFIPTVMSSTQKKGG
ncbi:membrane protein insertion efficiency factor YidD [Ilumatobacter sp.]|uniref:membrane protein insertion efficiency factor YidD n=1 Tax=Ilumatobacter sp. TaxID=1967498 RepID=UPI0037526D42